LRLKQWVQETFNLDGWWTCYQFDRAVAYLGNWVEGKMAEFERIDGPDGPRYERKYRLDELLGDKMEKRQHASDGGSALLAFLTGSGAARARRE
jgi:hypothetical protein